MSVHNVLLVSPGFHGYCLSMARAFEALGYQTSVCQYDVSTTSGGHVVNKVLHHFQGRLAQAAAPALRAIATARAVEAVNATRPDVIVTVKGDLLGTAYWDAVDRSKAAHVLWLYDELRRTRHDHDSLDRAGIIASYSPHDVSALVTEGRKADVVPLAYDPTYRVSGSLPIHELTFIGARYPSREALLLGLHAAGLAVRAYGRDWSHRPLDRLRTNDLGRPAIPTGPALSRQAAYTVMANGRATLNLHGDQDGFTMRTFEACGAGALQIVDRSDIHPYYEPGEEVVTFSSPDELLEVCQRVSRDTGFARKVRAAGQRRTLAEHTFGHRARQLETLWA